MDFTEKTISKDYKFRGRIMTVRVDQAELPNGKPCVREVCEHPGGVGVLPMDEHGMVTLVRQYRYPYGETILEIPAGKMDHGPENAEECGRHELAEETGLRAEQMIALGEIWPSPGFMDERLYLFCAKGLTQEDVHPDEDEFVERVTMSFDDLCALIREGTIKDAKTVAAVAKVLLLGLAEEPSCEQV